MLHWVRCRYSPVPSAHWHSESSVERIGRTPTCSSHRCRRGKAFLHKARKIFSSTCLFLQGHAPPMAGRWRSLDMDLLIASRARHLPLPLCLRTTELPALRSMWLVMALAPIAH